MTAYSLAVTDAYWDQPTHFTPNGTPGAGDTISANSTGQRLHVVGTREIGVSGAQGATNAIAFNSTNQRLVMSEDSFLRYRGEIYFNGGGAGGSANWSRVQFYPGSTLWHDSTAAADPTNQHYHVQLGASNDQYCFVDFRDSTNPSKRVTIGSEPGGGQGWFYVPNFSRLGGAMCAAGSGYADHIRWGNATNYSYTVRYGLGITGNQWRNMTFDTCGGIYAPSYINSAQPIFEDLTFQNTQGTYSIFIENAASIDGQGYLTRCALDKRFQTNRAVDWDVNDVVFGQVPTLQGNRAGQNPMANVVVIDTTTNAWSTWGGLVDGIVFIKHNSSGNPHGLQAINTLATNTVTRYVFLYTGPQAVDSGDAILMPSGAYQMVMTQCLIIDDKAHTSNDSTMFSMQGGGGAQISCDRCTCVGRGALTGETQPGATGQITKFQDNLVANYSPATRYKLYDLTGTTLNPVLPANAHHNGGHGHAAGSNGKGYDGMNLNPDDGTIGANDLVNVDPQFGRELYLEDFDADQGGAGTAQSAIDNLLIWNHPTSPPPGDYSPANILDAFLGDNNNWAPTNPAYENSDSAGTGTVGAKAYKQSVGPPVITGAKQISPLDSGVVR